MSQPGRRLSKSSDNKIKRRGKSVEHKEKISFKDQSKNEMSIFSIIAQTIKQTNQSIAGYNEGSRRFNGEFQSKQSTQIYEIQQKKSSGSKNQEFLWQIDTKKVQEKRKLKGIKAKVKWINNKDSNWFIVLRAVLSQNYIRGNQVDYYVELDSATIQIKFQEQKLIQKCINRIIEEEQNKAQDKNQIYPWLKAILIKCHNIFVSMKLYQRPKSKQTIFKRVEINERYMLYPCPASITWNPHGLLCLSENKVSNYLKPIIGSIHSYRNLVEAPKFKGFDRKNNEIEDLKMVDQYKQQQEEATQAQFYGWDAKQQINFSVFGGRVGEDQPMEETYNSNTENLEQNQRPEKRIMMSHETFFMGNANNFSNKVQKIYKRYFVDYGENIQFQFLQKLKIFTVKNQSSELEDGILYLIDKIQRSNREGVMQSLLQNEFAGYKNVLSRSDKNSRRSFFQKQKYELVSQFLQQKIKNTPQSQHFLYMKSIMVENQFFRLALQNYFQENFKRLKISDAKYQCLGSYDNFDDISAQKILFELLQQHLKADRSGRDSALRLKNKYKQKPEKYDDDQYKRKKYKRIQQQNEEMRLLLKGYIKKKPKYLPELPQIQSQSSIKKFSSSFIQPMERESSIEEELMEIQKKTLNRNVNLNLMPFLIINKVQFVPFQFNLILTQNQRKNFVETVIPILWIKDRSSEKFQYKLAKRVLIANSKIVKFLQIMANMGNVWKKSQGKRNTFLKNILKEYTKFKENSESMIGKNYIAYCQSCMGAFTAYSIQELFRVTLCSRCKYLQEVN